MPVLGHGGRNERQVPVLSASGGRGNGLADAIPAQVRAGAVELEGLGVKRQRALGVRLRRLLEQPVDDVEGAGGMDQVEAFRDVGRYPTAARQGRGRDVVTDPVGYRAAGPST